MSMIVGALITFLWSEVWHTWLHRTFPRDFPNSFNRSKLLAIMIGVLERGLLTTFIIWLPQAAGPFAGAWIAVKAVAGWGDKRDDIASRSRYYVALIGSLVSIFWAVGWGIWGMSSR